jgi:hypothetical protein
MACFGFIQQHLVALMLVGGAPCWSDCLGAGFWCSGAGWSGAEVVWSLGLGYV